MRFLVNQQLPPALVDWLQWRGHDAEHVRDIGMKEAEDSAIWNLALQIGAVIITKDEDFAARRARMSNGPAIVWLRFGNTTRPVILARLAAAWADIEAALAVDATVVEVR